MTSGMPNHTGILMNTLFGIKRINHKQNTPMPSSVSQIIWRTCFRLPVPTKLKMIIALTSRAAVIIGTIHGLLMVLDVA